MIPVAADVSDRDRGRGHEGLDGFSHLGGGPVQPNPTQLLGSNGESGTTTNTFKDHRYNDKRKSEFTWMFGTTSGQTLLVSGVLCGVQGLF